MPPIRKCESGYEKRKKKKRITELINSQRGALDKFVTKEAPIRVSNEPVDGDNIVGAGNPGIMETNENDNIENLNIDIPYGNDVPIENVDDENLEKENTDDEVGDGETSRLPDIFDPRRWDGLDSKMIDLLVTEGPKRDLNIVNGPQDKNGRRFTVNLYTRVLSNGEKCDRDWLVYSKELDKLFCFCCKIFRKGLGKGGLANDGFGDWTHVYTRLKEHEASMEHVSNMTTWYDLLLRFQKNQTIDKEAQKIIDKEKHHWKRVLERLVSIAKFLGKHNLAFRGKNEKLYQPSNGNFLGLIEMLADFDPVIQEHVRRIKNDELRFHYLGHNIQNELILLLASAIKNEIVEKIKKAKYFSVILDCTPDVSHQEQMTLILRYVDITSNPVSIEESFLGFLNVNDTTGQGLFNVLENELKNVDLDIFDVRGQGYDNGANMKGKHQGVQKRFLDKNPRAFYTPCSCHSLNLVLCDMASTCGKVRDFFGIIQRIYTIFAHSTKRWQILKDNIKLYTPKSLSSTRWESRLDSVKAIKLQMPEIREALFQVADVDSDDKIRSEAKSLAKNELGEFEFILAVVIWYKLLNEINSVSKFLQSKNMLIDVAIGKIKELISFFKGYRENGFNDAMEKAKAIALEMDVDPIFPQRRVIRRKRHFDENPDTSSTLPSPEESFKIQYFLYTVDQAIASLNRRFEQYQEYETTFGFLFTSHKLQSLNDLSLKSCCAHLENALSHEGKSDIDGDELYVELKLIRNHLPMGELGPIDILKFLQGMDL